jgi:pilus assembly protein Flp/PilA
MSEPTSQPPSAPPVDGERGVTALEYALLGVLVAIALIVGATTLGVNLNASYNSIAEHVDAADD